MDEEAEHVATEQRGLDRAEGRVAQALAMCQLARTWVSVQRLPGMASTRWIGAARAGASNAVYWKNERLALRRRFLLRAEMPRLSLGRYASEFFGSLTPELTARADAAIDLEAIAITPNSVVSV